MTREYKVRQGDCMSSISAREGFFWQTLWDKNPALKALRKDPNRLLPGDTVLVADKREKETPGATGQRHRFRKKGTPAMLRLIVERNHVPIRNTSYRLTVDGKVTEGETDDRGRVEASIDPTAERARLEIDDLVYSLVLGALDPETENVGIQARLQNLGFYEGELDGLFGPLSRAAIAEFRVFAGLEPGEEVDDAMRDKLFLLQDQEPQQYEEQEGEDEEAEPAGDPEAEEEDIEADQDMEEEDDDSESGELEGTDEIEAQQIVIPEDDNDDA